MDQTSTYSPLVMQETSDGLRLYDIRDEMLASREIEITGAIDAGSVSTAIRCLLHLQKEDQQLPITLYINSPGGEVQSGLALYDVMQAVSCPIHTVCLGMAASMAALLFIAGDQREMLPHSRVMIHDPLIGGGIGGSALSVKARADDRTGYLPAHGNEPRRGLRANSERHLFRSRRSHSQWHGRSHHHESLKG